MKKYEGMSDDEIAEAVVARLRGDFLASVDTRITTIEESLAALERDDALSPEAATALNRAVHNLKGMGTTFGYPLVSQIAERFESAIKASPQLARKELKACRRFLSALKQAIDLPTPADAQIGAKILTELPAALSG